MKILVNVVLRSLAVAAAAYLLPGIHVANWWTAVVVALVLGILNAILKPILVILTLPIGILTLGLFTLVINAAIVLLVAAIVPGFSVASFWWALLFGLVLSIVSSFLHWLEH